MRVRDIASLRFGGDDFPYRDKRHEDVSLIQVAVS
jgi:hypothetical protein